MLMSGQKFGHQVKTRSLEEDKLGFPRPSLPTTRLHGQVYQQSRLYAGIVEDEELAERAGEIGTAILEARSLRLTDIAVKMEGESAAGYKRIQRFLGKADPRTAYGGYFRKMQRL